MLLKEKSKLRMTAQQVNCIFSLFFALFSVISKVLKEDTLKIHKIQNSQHREYTIKENDQLNNIIWFENQYECKMKLSVFGARLALGKGHWDGGKAPFYIV